MKGSITKSRRILLTALAAITVFSAFACTDKEELPSGDSGNGEESSSVDDGLYATPIYEVEYLCEHKPSRYYKIMAQVSDDTTYEFLTRVPSTDHSKLRSDMHKQTDTLNALANANKDVNMYVYLSTELSDTPMADDIFPIESTHELFNEFFDRLDPIISSGYVDLNSVQDRIDKYYLSDHHWNEEGYMEAYRDIVAMFAAKYPDIVINEPKEHLTFPAVKWYGSFASAANLRTVSDTFGFYDFELPTHNLTLEYAVSYSTKLTRDEQKEIYLNGEYKTNDTYGHYIYFYRIAKKIVYPENNTGRNLWIIGDSYSPPLLETLSQYFDTTYIRYLDGNDSLRDVDYLDYIEKNGITDVVFVQMSSRIAYNLYSIDIDGLILK